MSEKGLELLSPAGSPQIARAVINAGANAIYFGGDRFGARAYAANFSAKEGEEIIRYGHLHGVKSYLTINTLLKNTEVERSLYDYAKAYYEAGVDGILVQDLGVFGLLKDSFPGLGLHASTQMTVSNIYGARFLQEQGFERLVVSREVSIAEMARIHESCQADLEAFVHGALCVCYSGQCYMSSMFGGRSGNRGRCAQPCRLPYTLLGDDGKRMPLAGPYVLSMKDLCGLEDIPALDAAGVYSLKIEGRMKQMSYALGVVRVYRSMIDQYLEKGAKNYRVDPKTVERLLDLGNRKGFTNVWLHENNSADMLTYTEPSHQHKINQVEEEEEKKYLLDGELILEEGKVLYLQANVRGHAVSCQLVGEELATAGRQAAEEASVAGKFLQLGGTCFMPGDFTVKVIGRPFVPVSVLKKLRRRMQGELEEGLIAEQMGQDFTRAQLQRRARPFLPLPKPARSDGGGQKFLSASVMDRKQLDQLIGNQEISAIYCPAELILGMSEESCERMRIQVRESGQKFYLSMPQIFRMQSESWIEGLLSDRAAAWIDGFMVSSLDALGYLRERGIDADKIIFDYRLYTMNNRALARARSWGCHHLTAPVELNRAELMHRDNEDGIICVYGHLPLMITANCLVKDSMGCDHRAHHLSLEDRKGVRMRVLNRCDSCYNLIYNHLPTMLLDQIPELASFGFREFRLDFSTESPDQMRKIIAFACRSVRGDRLVWKKDYTRGHYRRGVE